MELKKTLMLSKIDDLAFYLAYNKMSIRENTLIIYICEFSCKYIDYLYTQKFIHTHKHTLKQKQKRMMSFSLTRINL